MAELEKKWYVIRAIGGKEKKVKEYIESKINVENLTEYVFQVIIPTEKVVQFRNGKKFTKDRNYLPGYILVEAILIGEVIHVIKNVTNVIGFLGEEKGGPPLPLRLSEVNRMLGKVDDIAVSDTEVFQPFSVGENIKVTDGPFNGFSGIIEDVNDEKKKLKVMVKIFGRKTPLELGFMQVEKE